MIHIRFWRLPAPPARLPRVIRRAWLALALWRGWPSDAGTVGVDFDPFADIDSRLAWDVACGLEV